MVPVEWDLDGVSFDRPYETVAVTGSYGAWRQLHMWKWFPRISFISSI